MIWYRGGSKTASTAGERLCFRYMDSTIPLLSKFDRLCLIWPERPKAGFLVARLIYSFVILLFMFLELGYFPDTMILNNFVRQTFETA